MFDEGLTANARQESEHAAYERQLDFRMDTVSFTTIYPKISTSLVDRSRV